MSLSRQRDGAHDVDRRPEQPGAVEHARHRGRGHDHVTGLKHAVTTQPCGALNAGDFEHTVGAIGLGPLVRDQAVTVCFAGEATTGSATLTVSATSSIHDPNPGNNSATK